MRLGAVSGLEKSTLAGMWLFIDTSLEDFVDTFSEGLLYISSHL